MQAKLHTPLEPPDLAVPLASAVPSVSAFTDTVTCYCRIESPSNPLLGVADLPALISAGHRVGASVVVDSTFTTPLLQRPLELGADIAMHSVTKFIGGHSDLLMGALVAADPKVAQVCGLPAHVQKYWCQSE